MSGKIDIILPEPTTEKGLHDRWINNLASALMPLRSGAKRIKVKYL